MDSPNSNNNNEPQPASRRAEAEGERSYTTSSAQPSSTNIMQLEIPLDDAPPVPAAQTSLAYEEMENEIKNSIKNSPTNDLVPPVPPAQIAAFYEEMEDEKKDAKKELRIIEENEIPVPTIPSSFGSQHHPLALAAPPVSSESLSPRAAPRRILSLRGRGQRQRQAAATQQPPQILVASPNDNDETGALSAPNLYEVEATLVPNEPVYNAVPIPDEDSTPRPWWKRHQKWIFFGVGLLIVFLVATVGVLLSSRGKSVPFVLPSNSPSQSSPFPPSQVQTLRPTVTNDGLYFQNTTDVTTATTREPVGAIYYQSFEDGSLPERDGWSIPDNFVYEPFFRRQRQLQSTYQWQWKLSNKEAETGVYSIRTPEVLIFKGGGFRGRYNVTLTTPLDWGDGSLYFSILSYLEFGTGYAEDLKWYLDGEYAGEATKNPEWELYNISLEPGSHEVAWEYSLAVPSDYSGDEPVPSGAFMDNVYFIPNPVYYQSFEDGTFPEGDGWSTSQDNDQFTWSLSDKEAETGVYSIKTPGIPFGSGGMLGEYKLTFTTPLDWGDGSLYFSILSFFELGSEFAEDLKWYLDGEYIDEARKNPEWQLYKISLEPGRHEVAWVYSLEVSHAYSGDKTISSGAFIDNVFFIPTAVLDTTPDT